jgi:hypothetical protein
MQDEQVTEESPIASRHHAQKILLDLVGITVP